MENEAAVRVLTEMVITIISQAFPIRHKRKVADEGMKDSGNQCILENVILDVAIHG